MNLTKDDFTVDPALNVPFGGGPGDKLDRLRLRLLKEELKRNPDIAYVKEAAKEFIPGMQDDLKKIPLGSNLIIMPSTTGTNTVPIDVAHFLKSQRSDLRLINAGQDIIKTSHDNESKVKQNYAKLSTDPRQFEFDERQIARLAQKGRPSYILDDSISTGETAFVLQRQLSKRGVYAQGIIAAVSGGEKHTYPSDMLRLYNKITEDYPRDYAPEQLRKDIYTQFAGFPRRKETNFEKDITSGDPTRRADAIAYLRNSSEYYRQEQLDPASVLDRTPEGRTPWVKQAPTGKNPYEQLKLKYPNLNEEEISRYAKVMQQGGQRGRAPGKDIGLEPE